MFRRVVCAATWLAVLGSCAFAQNIAGTWKSSLREPNASSHWPLGMYVDAPTAFTLTVEGDKIVGVARIDGWPGNAKVVEGELDGESFSLTLVTEDNSTDGPQVLYCVGTVRGDSIEFTMRWPTRDLALEMKGKRGS
jgi:hypothetical protein